MLTHEKIENQRYRARYGRYYEEFNLGDVYEHRPGRTVTQHDNIQFSLMTMNAHPLHCDAAYSEKSEFGQMLVNSALTLAIVVGMTVNDVSAQAIANLGWKEVKLSHPVFAGDTLYAESKVISKRESKSRPSQGIVSVHTTAVNQNGTIVMEFERTFLVAKQNHRGNTEANNKPSFLGEAT